MIDSGYEEQPRKFCRLRRAAHLFLHALVVVDRALVRDQLIRETVQDDDLAAAIAEGREVGVGGAEYRAKKFDGLVHEQLEFGGGHVRAVEAARAREKIPIPVKPNAKRLW